MTAAASDDTIDRAALVRKALRALVAERGFHGASMAAVARRAGVATGTAYTHYASKDELIVAAYRETKAELGAAAIAQLTPEMTPHERFREIWIAIHRHLTSQPDDARFLLQVDHSPYRRELHAAVLAADDPLAAAAAEIADALLPLPLEVLWELGLSPPVRLVAGGIALSGQQLDEVEEACWRAVSPSLRAQAASVKPRQPQHPS